MEKCNDCALELQKDCPRYGGEVSCDQAEREVFKGIEYDLCTDSCYPIPECPVCGHPAFIREEDVNHTVECKNCHTRLRIPEQGWIRKYLNDNTGERIEGMPCGCGGIMKVRKVKRNGNWVTACGQCDSCGTRFLV